VERLDDIAVIVRFPCTQHKSYWWRNILLSRKMCLK